MTIMSDSNDRRYYEAAALLPPRVSAVLQRIAPEVAAKTQEIRMRVGRPLTLFTGEQHLFLSASGQCSDTPPRNAYIIQRLELFDCFRALCGYSVHTHQHEIMRGYISLPGGHRAGVCGTMTGEAAAGLRDVSSINLRVARQVKGVAEQMSWELFAEGLFGVLIAGPPSSGKTTIIRDMARILSSGVLNVFYKVAVVDERCELAAVCGGEPQNDIGLCTDLLYGYSKTEGIEIAVRTMSPQVLICDEIGREEELDAVRMGLFSAVQFITTVHCADASDLAKRPQARKLLETGAFRKVVVLEGSAEPGKVHCILSADEILN